MAKEALFKQSNAWRKIVASFFKTNGVWKQAIPFIKVDGEWIEIRDAVGEEYRIYAVVDSSVRKASQQGGTIWEVTPSRPPYLVAVDPRGFVLIGGQASSLFMLDENGEEIWYLYRAGSSIPRGLAIDSFGNSYIELGAGYVTKYDPAGNEEWSARGGNYQLEGIAVDALGNVYVIYDTGSSGWIYKFDSSGETVWGNYINRSGKDVAVDADEFVYLVLGNGEVRKLNPDGDGVWQESLTTSSLDSIAVDPDRNVHVASSIAVYKLFQDGSLDWDYQPPSGSIVNIALDPDRFVYAAVNNGQIHKIDQSGSLVETINLQAGALHHIAVDPGIYGAFPSHW